MAFRVTRRAGEAALEAEKDLRFRRDDWIAARQAERQARLEAPTKAASEAQRKARGARIRELVGARR
jgi:hypothetical protein